MDFHGLTRRELQALCKKNKIPANQTNVAMADALQALSTIEGIEEILCTDVSRNPQVPVETPNPSRTCSRSTRKKLAIPADAEMIEFEDSSAPVARTTRRGTAARASVSRRKILSEEKEEAQDASDTLAKVDNVETFQTPARMRDAAEGRATVTRSLRRTIEAQPTIAKDNVMPSGVEPKMRTSIRRSARLISENKAAELPSSTKSRRKVSVKIAALTEESGDFTKSPPEKALDTVKADMVTNMQEPSESAEEAVGFADPHDLRNGGGGDYDKFISTVEVEVPDERTDGVTSSVSESRKLEKDDAGELLSDKFIGDTLIIGDLHSPIPEPFIQSGSYTCENTQSEKIADVQNMLDDEPIPSAVEMSLREHTKSDFVNDTDMSPKQKDEQMLVCQASSPKVVEDEDNSINMDHCVEKMGNLGLEENSKVEMGEGDNQYAHQADHLNGRDNKLPLSANHEFEGHTSNSEVNEDAEEVTNIYQSLEAPEQNMPMPEVENDLPPNEILNGILSEGDKMDDEQTREEVLGSLNSAVTELKIEEYEQVAGLAVDVSNADTNLFIGEVPVDIMEGNELLEYFEGVADNGREKPEDLELKYREADIISPAGIAIFSTVKESEMSSLMGHNSRTTSRKMVSEILGNDQVPKIPILVDIVSEESLEAELESGLLVGTEKTPKKKGSTAAATPSKSNGKKKVSEISDFDEVPQTPILVDILSEEFLEPKSETGFLVGTEKTPTKKDNSTATPGKSNGKKVVLEDVDKENNGAHSVKMESSKTTPGKSNGKKKSTANVDKENNGAHSVKRESAKKGLRNVGENLKEKNKYQDLSLRQLKVLYKEKKATEVMRKSSALQPLNQNCLLCDGTN